MKTIKMRTFNTSTFLWGGGALIFIFVPAIVVWVFAEHLSTVSLTIIFIFDVLCTFVSGYKFVRSIDSQRYTKTKEQEGQNLPSIDTSHSAQIKI